MKNYMEKKLDISQMEILNINQNIEMEKRKEKKLSTLKTGKLKWKN